MKRLLKFLVCSVLAIFLFLIIGILLVRFAFRNEAANFVYEWRGKQHIEILQLANTYQSDSVCFSFGLLAQENKSQDIRNYFQLDSLVSKSDDTWDATLRIARIAASIKHDNPDPRPSNYNAIDLWEWGKEHPNGFNCRAHSILLHELLLSVGIANKVITCSPEDTTDRDCHVVNVVWLPEKEKWVMVDSDKHAYATDESGSVLSLQEMRTKVINEQPVSFHSFTEDSIQQRDRLFYYWAKNLYYFDAIEKQTYDIESAPSNRYRKVYLVPDKNHAPKSFRSRHDILTTDVDRFWSGPIPIE